MSLATFSVIGGALHFGARRMETIARIAWLPVLLLLIVNMASVFAYLSVIADRAVTFADVADFLQAEELLYSGSSVGWEKAPEKMLAITVASLGLQAILIASFLAPLIRYAGLGEHPAPGLFRLLFGADQIRFLIAGAATLLVGFALAIAPIAIASYYVIEAIIAAMSKTMASFPDAESLHTIELVTAGESLIASGAAWVVDLALPLAAAAPFALLAWVLGFLHFHPKNRPHADEEGGNGFLRALAVLVIGGGLAGAMFLMFRGAAIQSLSEAGDTGSLVGTPVNALIIFTVIAALLVVYFNIRLFAYPAIAVCRRSMAPATTLAVTRGWNLFRVPVIVIVLWLIMSVVSMVINVIAMPMILSTLLTMLEATEVSTRLVNAGEKAAWVTPLFVWIWNFTIIGANFLWTFFSYGVIAGLYGKLYRDSVRLA